MIKHKSDMEGLDAPLSVSQFAALMGLSEETVRRRIADETIPAIRLAGVLRIPRQFVRDLVSGKVA
jgi:excisionase family DNA binding protein